MTQPRRRHLASSPFARAAEVEQPVFETDQRVLHDTYGLGRVVGKPSAKTVSVDFGNEIRHISLPTSKLSIL